MLPDEKIKLVPDADIRRVVLCSGKVYYDLYEEREKRGIDDVYLMRVEQLYPVPLKALVQELGRFKKAEVVWCQEEPRNMGAWHFIEPYLEWVLESNPGAEQASALRRPRGRGGHRDRLDVQACGAAQGAARRGAELKATEACSVKRSRLLSQRSIFLRRPWPDEPDATREETAND